MATAIPRVKAKVSRDNIKGLDGTLDGRRMSTRLDVAAHDKDGLGATI
jgi:hypothetical protein